MKIDMTEQVSLYIANDEYLYCRVLDAMVEAYETDGPRDEDRIRYIADVIELEVRDFYLTGNESDAGSWLIRSALDTVNWYTLAHEEYSDFLADRGEDYDC